MDKHQKTKEYLEKWHHLKLSDTSRARMEKDLTEYARFHGVKTSAQRAEPGVFAGIRERLRAQSKNSRAAGATGSVRVDGDSRSIEQAPTVGASFVQRLINLNSKSMTAFIVTLALLVGGGTSYAAEGAVPGDLLYPIKVEVNENVKSALAVSADAEARLQARLAEERLEEAQKLAARGELTTEASVDISTRLKSHYDAATKSSDKAQAEGDYEYSATMRASLEGSLRTHADVLTDLNSRVSGNNGDVLIATIRTYANTTAEAQAKATATVDVSAKVEIENTIKRADSFIAEVKTKLARAKGKMSASAYARIEARFEQAVNAQAEAKANLRAELYSEAYHSVQNAIRLANEVETMIDSTLRFKIDVDVKTDGVLDTVIDVRTETNPESDLRTPDNSDSTTEDTDRDSNDSRDTEIDVEIDAGIDTDVIKTDTSVRSNTGLSI